MKEKMTVKQCSRFMSRIHKNRINGCWEWTATRFQQSGYGRFKFNGKDCVAHRVAYEHIKGPVSHGLELDHLCRNRHCVNPEHLEPVTHQLNELRGDTIIAENAMKTHCKRGHELIGKNLLIRKDGRRRCQVCERKTQKRIRSTDLYRKRRSEYEHRRGAMKRKKIDGGILASGEHTNHHHRVTVDVYEGQDGTREFEGATTITHEEHGPITLPDGEWVSGQVQEFDHLEQQLRTVRD